MRNNRPRAPWRRTGAIAMCLTLSACMVGPDYRAPDVYEPESFFGANADLVARAEPEIQWWAELHDPILNRLIVRAIRHNHSLRIARANLRTARALLDEQRFQLYPIVPVGGGISREKFSESSSSGGSATGGTSGGDTGGFDRTQTFYDVGLDASWELDFFGGVRRSIESLSADYQAFEAQPYAVFISVAAEVARTYVEARGAQYQLNVARRNASNQQSTFELTRTLLEGGRGTAVDIARARAQLATTLATIPPLEVDVARAIHRLSVLVGRPPGALYTVLAKPRDLPALPTVVGIGDPGLLLRRRPDIFAAERRLASATARIGVRVADLFPRVRLIGSFGYLSTSIEDLLDESSQQYSFGPTLSWAAFDLGRVRARIRAAEASADGQLATYERTVLRALEETENAIVGYTREIVRRARLRVAANASQRAAKLSRIRYRGGVDSFINVLDAERRLLEAQTQLAVSETQAARSLVALYKALGGGWQYAFGGVAEGATTTPVRSSAPASNEAST